MMFGSSLVLRRLWPRVSPRVLCVASNLLSGCNDAINTIGYKQCRLKSGRFILPNANRTLQHIEPAQGLLQFHTQCWNLTSIRSYGRPRFSPEHLTEAQIIDAVKSGEYRMDDVALCFSRKQLYKQKQFSPQFSEELGGLFVRHYSALKKMKPKAISWLLTALTNLKSPISPSFIDVPLRRFQTERNSKNLFNELVTMAGFLPLLNWSSIPPNESLILICRLIMPMISEVEDRYLTYLLHTWCKENGWKQIARGYLITNTYLKECQRRVPKIEAKGLVQLLEAVSDSLPLPSHVQLAPGWLEDVQKRLLSLHIPPTDRGAAATLLDAFWQIQNNCLPSQHQLSIPVAKRMFKVWFDPKQKCIARIQTLTFLVLRAMGQVGIDPGDLDKRFWPWLWREVMDTVEVWRDDQQRAIVLDALYELKIPAQTKCVQKIINTIRADNPMLASKLLYSLARIKEHMPALQIHEKIKRSLSKGYIDSMSNLSEREIIVGGWSFGKLGITPTKVDSNFWIKFYKRSESCMTKFTCHQQTMLLSVLSHPSNEPPTAEWLSMLIAAIDSTPADSASGAALILWNLMLLHQHLDDPARESKDLLDVFTQNQEERILKFYNHWLKGMEDINTLNAILFPLDVMDYFGLEANVGNTDLVKWCKCMEKYCDAKWRAEDKRLFHKIVDAFKLPDSFRRKILKK